jgi:hypothetical protein
MALKTIGNQTWLCRVWNARAFYTSHKKQLQILDYRLFLNYLFYCCWHTLCMLVPGSWIQSNNPSAMLVGYDIANPPGYVHNPLIRLGQTVKATYDGTSRSFVVTGILNEAGNPNVDKIVVINTNTGNSFFHRLGRYDQMVVLASSGNYVPSVVQETYRQYGSNSFGIVAPAAVMLAQKHTQSGNSSFTLEVGFLAMLVSAIGVVITLYTSVNERTVCNPGLSTTMIFPYLQTFNSFFDIIIDPFLSRSYVYSMFSSYVLICFTICFLKYSYRSTIFSLVICLFYK